MWNEDYTAISMSCHRWLALALAAPALLAAWQQERLASDYPASVQLGDLTLAAENLGPGVPSPAGDIYADGYLVIEVALFGAKGRRVELDQAGFRLRINGAKSLIAPDSPGMVAASVKYPDWERSRWFEATAGAGSGTVIMGRPRPVERFPGDRRPVESRVPNPIPRQGDPAASKPGPEPVEDVVNRAALAGGDQALPVRGCLYYPYKRKLKSIRKLELVYAGPLGETTLRIP